MPIKGSRHFYPLESPLSNEKSIRLEQNFSLTRQMGCFQRERAFSRADLLQTLVFGWPTHPDASLETLASTAAIREVYVSDTAVHKRLNESCARFLHAIVEEVVSVLAHAEQPVPLELLHRFSSVVLEDSSSIDLPRELADCWRLQRLPTDAPVWVSFSRRNYGQAIGPRTIANMCEEFSSSSKVHTTRHTAALKMLQSGASLEDIRKFPGHKNAATTAIYIETTLVDYANPYATALEDAFGI